MATEARWDVTEAGKQQAHSVPSFGQLLRRYRTLARLTQEELAERSGYSTDYIGKLERDQRQPPLIAVDRLVAVFALGETEHERLLAARERHGTSHLPAQPPSPSSLPSAPTPLIGRVAERAAVHAALDASRLVTLTGVGGTGKTRLALQVAERLLDAFPDGVYFVSLTSVPDASLVPSAIAGTLGLHEAGRQAPFDALQEHLRDKHLLLVLDGFEHLLEAAPLIGELLAGCPELRILVTSRAVLHLAAEQVYPVPPLSLPDLQPLPETADLAHYDAVALFLARAQAVRSDFTLTAEDAPAVAEICHRLDGLPLAIELAAARVRLFLPPALLERLSSPLGILTGGARDLPARQQTLRGTLDWSYGLLSNGEQRLFRRLAVFAGGCTLQAAEVVCNREEDLDVVETVSSLLDQSLLCPAEVTSEEPRVVMLQTIREYALEQLEESGEVEALRRRHADYYLALAEKAEPALLGAGQTTWLSHLEQEHGNLRAALRWCLRPGEAERGLRLGAALWRFYQARGHLTEGREWLEGLLRLQESSGSSGAALVRARALVSASRLARAQGDIARAATLAEEGLELSRQLRDKDTGAGALITLGHAALVWGDIRRAEDCCQEALALAQETGNTWSIAEALHHLGTQAMGQGEYDRAVSLYEQSLVLWRECGDGVYLGATLIKLGDLASYFEGDRNKAARLYGESVAVFRDLADRRGTGHALAALADLAQEQGDFERAEALAAESLQLLRDLGERHITAWATQVLADVVLKQGDAMRALALLRQSLVLAQSVGHTDIVASMLGDLGRVAWAQARPARAACLCGAAAALRAAVGTTILPQQQGVYDRLLADVRQALGEGACDLAWDRGRAMPMEQAITYALQDAVD